MKRLIAVLTLLPLFGCASLEERLLESCKGLTGEAYSACSQAAYAEAERRRMMALVAMQGVQAYAASQQVNTQPPVIAPPQRPVQTTCIRNGNTVNCTTQ